MSEYSWERSKFSAALGLPEPIRTPTGMTVGRLKVNPTEARIRMAVTLQLLEPEDSNTRAQAAHDRLKLERSFAAHLGHSAVDICQAGEYHRGGGEMVDIGSDVAQAIEAKESIAPDEALSVPEEPRFESTRVRLVNDTTLAVARELVRQDDSTAALNFANGVQPGGGFLNGALAQEETLCRSSGLYVTLKGDPMYAEHRKQADTAASSAWIIRSPSVPVFRTDGGDFLEEPWRVTFLTCAAPYAPFVGQPLSHELLDERIGRVLLLASARGHASLVLGAWGCGAFRNDPKVVAGLFRKHVEAFAGHFREVVFAVTDWSEERRTFGPFAEALAQHA